MGRYRGQRGDSKSYIDWLDKADDDLEAARILKNCKGDNEIIAFHCQQCIEKALKAYLLLKAGRHFDGHSLIYLCRKACDFDESFKQWLDESADLNRYYIETRYPADIPLDINDKHIEKLYNMAFDMFSYIEGKIAF